MWGDPPKLRYDLYVSKTQLVVAPRKYMEERPREWCWAIWWKVVRRGIHQAISSGFRRGSGRSEFAGERNNAME